MSVRKSTRRVHSPAACNAHTGNRWRVAEEDLVSFTHDRELPWLLPGVPPTHRRVEEVLAVWVVAVERSLIASHRTLWDQTALLTQLGLAHDMVRTARAG